MFVTPRDDLSVNVLFYWVTVVFLCPNMPVFSISSLHRLTNWLVSVPHTVICRLIQFVYKKVFQSLLNKDETPVQCNAKKTC